MDSSVIFPKCAKKCLRKILPFACIKKKPKVKEPSLVPPPPPPTPSPATRKEDVHDGGDQPSMGGDFNRVEDLMDNMARMHEGITSIEVRLGTDDGDPINDHCYHPEYGCPTRGARWQVPPFPPSFVPPPRPREMLPPSADYVYGCPGPFMASRHTCHHAYRYPRGAPPPAYYDDY